MSFQRKDVRDVVAELETQGWVVVRHKRHIVLKHECGALITVACSPSDARALKNTRKKAYRSVERMKG